MQTAARRIYSIASGWNKSRTRRFPSAKEQQKNMRKTKADDEQFGGNTADVTSSDGIDRRSFLSCMAWVGTGIVWTMAGGVPTSKLFAATGGAAGQHASHAGGEFSFVQISDSHIGFNKAANQDVTKTLQLAIDRHQRIAGNSRLYAAYRRYQPVLQSSGVRYRRAGHQKRKNRPHVLCSGRARRRAG